MAYKGMMLSGVPNAAMAIGYTNASWTLKCDLTCEYVCRLLNHMDATTATARWCRAGRPVDHPRAAAQPELGLRPALGRPASRSQGSKRPWRMYQNYALDVMTLRLGELDDGVLRFSRRAAVDGRGAPAASPRRPAAARRISRALRAGARSTASPRRGSPPDAACRSTRSPRRTLRRRRPRRRARPAFCV